MPPVQIQSFSQQTNVLNMRHADYCQPKNSRACGAGEETANDGNARRVSAVEQLLAQLLRNRAVSHKRR